MNRQNNQKNTARPDKRQQMPQQHTPRSKQTYQGNGQKKSNSQQNTQADARYRAAKEAQKKKDAELAKRRKALEQKKKKEAADRKKAEEKRRRQERYTLSEEEQAIREQMQKEEQAHKKRQRQRRAKLFLGRLFVFLCMFVLLLSISVGLFYANLVSYERSAHKNFVYHVGDKNAANITAAYDKIMRGGTMYLNMTPIVALCDMAVTGDTAELRYISRNAKENVQFIVGSTQVFINGVEHRLTAAPVLDGDDLYVPYDFFTSYVKGLNVLYDMEKNRITVERILKEGSDSIFSDLTFVIRSDAPMTALDEFNEFGQTSPIEFLSALDLYEEYMNPVNRDDYLILVNKEYPLPQSYKPATEKLDYSDMLLLGQPDQYLDPVAYKAAHAMVMELAANGYADTKIHLGYRSYEKQNTFYTSTVNEYQRTMSEEQAKIAAASVAQEPGCNPQQTGLSFIMHNGKEASSAFSREAAYGWLAENCWKFGFIIRYPADKTAETGMAFQPCFFTFVGRYHAMRIASSGLSMEEYIAALEEKDYFGMPYAQFREALLNKKNQ